MAPTEPIRYRLSPAAQYDLEEIWLYSAQNWSSRQAERYTAMLRKSLAQLLAMPELAPERTVFTPPVRIHPSGKHLIVYRVSGENLDVLRILGGQQDWLSILGTLES